TKLCPTPYDPNARCPAWLRFLGDVFSMNQEVIDFLQRLLGYCLTGDVREQILPIFWGEGSNGKSTLCGAIEYVMGDDYFGTPPETLFVESQQRQHPAEFMTLQGKRLMVLQETSHGERLNESRIKHLTGGDKIQGRGMHQNWGV